MVTDGTTGWISGFCAYKERKDLGEKQSCLVKLLGKKRLWSSAPLHYSCSLENEMDGQVDYVLLHSPEDFYIRCSVMA